MEACPLEPRRLESVENGGRVREKMLIQTEPGVLMPFFAFRPSGSPPKGGWPVLIMPHGHGPGKEAPGTVSASGLDFTEELVGAGFVVLRPDARGSGERREWTQREPRSPGECSHREINQMAIGLGLSLAGMMCWDLMRLVDYISLRDDCDASRVGCGGMSGGGMQSLWLGALDQRIRCTVTSGYYYGFKGALLELPHNCACNYVPGLWESFDVGDFGALAAPRPLLVETGSRDPLNGPGGLANVLPHVETARRAYSLYGAEDRLEHRVFEGGHEWNGSGVLAFVERWLSDA
jgi:Dipeptidyl aminopeptidases/acylaminoacyl-peptidases